MSQRSDRAGNPIISYKLQYSTLYMIHEIKPYQKRLKIQSDSLTFTEEVDVPNAIMSPVERFFLKPYWRPLSKESSSRYFINLWLNMDSMTLARLEEMAMGRSFPGSEGPPGGKIILL